MYAAAHEGKLPSEMIEEERQRAEEERQRAEEERQRAEEERQRAEETVVRLHIQLFMPIEQIALAMDISPQAVEEILHRHGHK
jgi:membrane protein involved in colicin uptake